MLLLTVNLKFFARETGFHYVLVWWLSSADIFEYHCNIKNKEKILGLVLPATPQWLEIYCVWRESGHFFGLSPSLKAQRKAQWKQVSDFNFKEWTEHLLCFSLIERLFLKHTGLLRSLSVRPIHNPAVRLTVIRAIRPRKRNTFAQVGELEHPLLHLQENFIPRFRLTHKQWQMKQGRWQYPWRFRQKEMKGMWISS